MQSAPRVYYVNWFRKSADGKFLWSGYGENSRLLKWVFERCDGKADARETPIGLLPTKEVLDTAGLEIPADALDELLSVDVQAWRDWIRSIKKHYEQFGDRLPAGLKQDLADLEKRLADAG